MPSAMVHKAVQHLAPTAHYIKYQYVAGKRVSRSLFFNTKDYMGGVSSTHEPVTAERVNR